MKSTRLSISILLYTIAAKHYDLPTSRNIAVFNKLIVTLVTKRSNFKYQLFIFFTSDLRTT